MSGQGPDLRLLGVTHFLRVGTAGSLQPQRIHCGDVVIASAAVAENKHYMTAMKQAGVIASEMECAQLFTVSSLMSASQPNRILSGAILAIVGDEQPFSSNQVLIQQANEAAIALSLETTRQMSAMDRQ